MGLFFCAWRERVCLLVDAADDKQAIQIAAGFADGELPERVTVIQPGLFAAEVDIADEGLAELLTEDDLGTLTVVPLEHTEDLLADLVNADLDEVELCGEEADGDDGKVYRCDRAKGHAGSEHSEGDIAWQA